MHNIIINEISVPKLYHQRENDKFIMEARIVETGQVTQNKLKPTNGCRLHLQVMMLSDIVT